MRPFLTEDQSALKTQLRHWVEQTLFSREEGDCDEDARKLARLFAERGLIAYVANREDGGVREKVQARDICLIREEIARGSALADSTFAMQGLGTYPISLAGTREQRARYLPPVIRGEHLAAFAITEPEAGSDVASMTTRATRDGDVYRVNGVKRFISNAGIAQTYSLFAKTSPEAGAKGVSAFIVEWGTPGFVLKEKTPVISPHPIGVIGFNDCRVPASQRLGQEGEGIKIALGTLDLFRCTVGAAAVGLAQRALEEGLGYAAARKQFGRALAEFQAIQFKLADMATELEAARLLVYRAAWTRDVEGKAVTLEASMAKLYATEAAQRVIDQALQIHGGAGVVVGTPVERLYRDIRAMRIYEGTSEIQHLVIARQLLRGAG